MSVDTTQKRKKEIVEDPSAEKVLLDDQEFTLEEITTCIRVLWALGEHQNRSGKNSAPFYNSSGREQEHIREARSLVMVDGLSIYGYALLGDRECTLQAFQLNQRVLASRLVHYDCLVRDGVFKKYGSNVVRGWEPVEEQDDEP